MKKSELIVLNAILKQNNHSLEQLSKAINMNYSVVSRVFSSLKVKGFDFDGFSLKNNVLLTNFTAINLNYSLDIFENKKEDILFALLFFTKVSELSKYLDLSEIQINRLLNKLRERGVVIKNNSDYNLNNKIKTYIENIYNFYKLKDIEPYAKYFVKKGNVFKIVETGKLVDGKLTAFSLFNNYGIDYNLIYDYYVVSNINPSIEDVFIHSFFLADSKKDYAMIICFYLRNKDKMSQNKIFELATYFGVKYIYEKILAYVREGKEDPLFLPKKEFIRILNEYSLSMDSLSTIELIENLFFDIGNKLQRQLDIYLIGGGNLMLKKLKSVTKDTDIIVNNEDDYKLFESELDKRGFIKDTKLANANDHLRIRMVFKKDTMQIDVFVKKVMNQIFLNDLMITKCEIKGFGKLNVKLVSLEDIILFKAIAGREGDVEDLERILMRSKINWDYLYDQFVSQFDNSSDLMMLSIFETLDLVSNKYPIPILNKIERFVLEKSILFICKTPKSIPDIKKILEFPDSTIRNVINKQVKDGLLKTISGKLKLFQTIK